MSSAETSKSEPLKTVRFEARMTLRQKELFQHAADLRGQSLTDFALTYLQEAAERVIRECEVMQLTAKDSLLLVDAFLNPPTPNEALQKAAKRYQQGLAGF